uniref:farnesyl diphosphate synthase 2-like isoform X2 n=1 Tax=Erigeron canadensis TaxID=72917 RepID=UPI001CB8D5BA|nr:farnesyl diphosphate synthase 2-like isoform X2 [Erigeron canadensis]
MASFNRLFIGSSRLSSVGPRTSSSLLNCYSSLPRTTLITTIDMKSKFQQVYDTLKYELLHDPSFVFDDDSRQWVDKMIDYNVPGGKMVRAVSVVDSYWLLKEEEELTDNEVFLACALGWSIEWLQAYLIVHDDIMDGSYTRRGQPCWFRLSEIGMSAVNDGVILRNHVFKILKRYFHNKVYYVHLLDLFNEVEFQTVSGQMIDAIAAHVGEKDLSNYTLSFYRRMVAYKSSYYSFYLPVACAFLMFGESLDDHIQMKDILVEMGIYYQVQNDYLDTFGDPNVFGKTGTDTEERKCSWLVVKALELANEEQKKILNGAYEEYENKTNEELVKSIEAYPNKVVQEILKSCLTKIYRKHK